MTLDRDDTVGGPPLPATLVIITGTSSLVRFSLRSKEGSSGRRRTERRPTQRPVAAWKRNWKNGLSNGARTSNRLAPMASEPLRVSFARVTGVREPSVSSVQSPTIQEERPAHVGARRDASTFAVVSEVVSAPPTAAAPCLQPPSCWLPISSTQPSMYA